MKTWFKKGFQLFSLFASVLSITALLNYPAMELSDLAPLCCILLTISFVLSIPSHYKTFKINGFNNLYIEVVIGDMFKEKCDMIISTNSCFDVDKECIRSDSLQGLFCKKIYKDDTLQLRKDIQIELKKNHASTTLLPQKKIGEKKQYPINTIITLKKEMAADSPQYHWIAINHSDNQSGVIMESVNIFQSVIAIWEYLQKKRKRRDLCIPMIGTGYAKQSVLIPDLVEFYIDTFIFFSQKEEFVKTLKIYLYPKNEDVFEDFLCIVHYLEYYSKHVSNLMTKYLFIRKMIINDK